ncbi:uncharacterized protein L969DRAFT_144368 [Mixia osmundae IAM 14324]|uniref:RWD domain-containing protein n=1 Tax=Mixia osmundae (strain CBS 9802 / IAM 14324 / JCM 22182 / KY 12970) TaxID=764103 RepID=G7E884_MIXOS|nr:uncharacterized protein L969DRAFT_144368 [Mixia osmundae IAM 14324]KEI42364.1 hypothetical protein L969DRAFT_144368 [Mixia osmundae IAM 14324]GAA99044.1 hypothetical protein E5Q_05733 [Mixia osmundae IAM 14324]
MLNEPATLREQVQDELEALIAIYGGDKVKPEPAHRRCTVLVDLASDDEPLPAELLLSLPEGYPDHTAPRIQLLSRYIGPFAVEPALFGQILRIYFAPVRADEDEPELPSLWQAGQVALFEGIEAAKEILAQYYRDHLVKAQAADYERQADRDKRAPPAVAEASIMPTPSTAQSQTLPCHLKIVSCDPIVDRKSVFVGHACRLKSRDDVSSVLSYLLSDRKIARAAHNISAWRWRAPDTGIVHHDCDDDGETAAGGRLAHLLELCHATDVVVVVSRWFGGVHLGPDRFKHINAAARAALLLSGAIE